MELFDPAFQRLGNGYVAVLAADYFQRMLPIERSVIFCNDVAETSAVQSVLFHLDERGAVLHHVTIGPVFALVFRVKGNIYGSVRDYESRPDVTFAEQRPFDLIFKDVYLPFFRRTQLAKILYFGRRLVFHDASVLYAEFYIHQVPPTTANAKR